MCSGIRKDSSVRFVLVVGEKFALTVRAVDPYFPAPDFVTINNRCLLWDDRKGIPVA